MTWPQPSQTDGLHPAKENLSPNILINQAKTLQLVELARRLPRIRDDKKYRFQGTMEELLAHYHNLVMEGREASELEETTNPSPKESLDA